MPEYPKYWKAAYNKKFGLGIMCQTSATENSIMIVEIMLIEKEAQELADAILKHFETKWRD